MAEKDILEKTLEGHNDVFADIVNALLFQGEQIVMPEDLEDQLPRSLYKADGKIRELERDVAKRWKKQNIRIACIGMENQTAADRYMTLRVAGYDGSEYRLQVNHLKDGQEPYPVITIVLYFGYRKRWDQPVSLYEALNVSEKLKPFVNDVKLNLFEIAFLTREQVNLFRSDFKIVADYFVQMRESGTYRPGNDEVRHIQDVLALLNVMDQDHRFESLQNEVVERGEVKTMSEWLSRVINESEARGKAMGEARGEAIGNTKGENRFASLIKELYQQNRIEDIQKAATDPEIRKQLFAEFKLQ